MSQEPSNEFTPLRVLIDQLANGRIRITIIGPRNQASAEMPNANEPAVIETDVMRITVETKSLDNWEDQPDEWTIEETLAALFEMPEEDGGGDAG